eukprot:g1578.t1
MITPGTLPPPLHCGGSADAYARYHDKMMDKQHGEPMELEERFVGLSMRLWADPSLDLLGDERTREAVRTTLALHFLNKASGESDVELLRVIADDRGDNGVRFDVRLRLMSFSRVGSVERAVARAFDQPEPLEGRLRGELRAVGRGTGQGPRARVVTMQGELGTPRGQQLLPQRAKLFPAGAPDLRATRERLAAMARRDAGTEVQRLAVVRASKVRATDARAWRCHLCGQRNQTGTMTCRTCGRASSYGPKSLARPREPAPLPLHANGPAGVSVEQVFTLAQEGVDFNARDHFGLSALHAAARAGRAALVDALLRARPARGGRADVEARTKDDWRPLHYAAQAGSSETVQRLAREGCALDEPTRAAGHAPLHLCAIADTAEAAQSLIEAGVDVNAHSRVTGQTPLHLAAWHGNLAMTEVLLRAGADMEARDKEGWVPLQMAQFRGHEAVEHLLLDNHARQGTWRTPLWDSVKKASFEQKEGKAGR